MSQSLMLMEAGQSPEVVATLLDKEKPAFDEIAKLFSAAAPSVVTTAARGSSDHAATFFKYLFEISCGVPVASIGPSIASIYGSSLHLKNGVHFTVSQSGASPDIVALQDAAKRGGATTIAVVNVTDSPLAKQADIVIGLNAGPGKERRCDEILHRIGRGSLRRHGSHIRKPRAGIRARRSPDRIGGDERHRYA